MKVRCCDCVNCVTYLTSTMKRYYCKPKGFCMPERKYERRHKCGWFEALASLSRGEKTRTV